MGVDTRIYLPDDVRVKDVATVMGIAAGLPFEKIYLKNDGWYVECQGVSVGSTSFPEMVEIEINGNMVDGENMHHVNYHFEVSDSKRTHYRLLISRSTAFWIMIGKRLVDFFGGELDYSDSDKSEVDYSAYHVYINNPEDNAPWQKLQERMTLVTPISQAELEQADLIAAYKMEKY